MAVLAALEGLLERLGLVLGRLEGILDGLGGILGASWRSGKRLGNVLEAILASLGAIWGVWSVLGPKTHIKGGKTSVDTVKLLKLLYKKDIKKILLEGGGTINWTFLKNGFVDEIIVTITPYILGGSNSISLVEGVGFKNLFPTKKLKLEKIQKIGSELVVYYRI